ncbi:short-chain dehydrogenase [Aliarcobacter cryaerophilus ATCC 43158]|uniref:Short-chain dehydrogenase/reductase n=1 Tax=Aliarcobacter cryaerophilus ATCC 43158 TaxID=1032070 RepID=A0AAD0TSR4_9BACT|nr:SDR family NAD(P)-dependent oxidoreductase [Aliarcobacter cryaerophilus]AYJ79626.1 short-chain dehydrogenase/reductase [Aliarcobacter cryaerophilus ATCC 43158]PRM95256.1 short-chain dehydrogenase [Aliarcobacter cryaerophilus]QCZ23867.1 short-chain dehydrogenase [Aliarcobacter cryaerophilus ATCC 43158]
MEKKVWIIGCSGAIGFELVKLWLKSGFKVVASSRNVENSEQFLNLKSEYSTNLKLLNIDVLDEQNTKKVAHEAFNNFNGLDICFYNAAIYESMSYEQWNIENFESMINSNYLGVIRVLKPIISHLENQLNISRVVLNCSLASYFGLPYGGAYSASKAALLNFAQSIQPELKRKNIYLQVINHGFVRSRLTAKNDFKMPQIMEADFAAKKIFDELNKSYRFEITFPRFLSNFLKFLSFLPYTISLKITSKFLK